MSESQPKVSIIIPVYKAEKYIERCVRTLFGQTLDELEYIFVDDCSPDRSIEVMERVLKEYPDRKPQVKVIRHDINRGVSQSRQDGVDAASGEYIIHCDPDDWVEPDMYEQLYTKAKETVADIVICDFNDISNGKSNRINQKPQELTNISLLKSISGISKKNIHGALWNKLIKSHLYRNLKFPKGINFCEDVCVLFQLLQNDSLKIAYLNKSFYNYKTDTPGSLFKITDADALEMDRQLIELISSDIFIADKYSSCKKSFIIQTIFNRAFLTGEISDKEFKIAYKEFEPLIKYGKKIHAIDKFLLKIAMKGKLTFARELHYIILNIYKDIKYILGSN